MNEPNQTPDRLSGGGDGLQQIKGVGQVVASAMNSVGIHSYADLAGYTREGLADLLRAEIPTISPKYIERYDWIGQARALVKAADTEPTSFEGEAEVEKKPQRAPLRKKEEWEEHHSFHVSFEYKVNEHSEPVLDEHGERIWQTRPYDTKLLVDEPIPGISTASWVNWILKRADLPVEAQPIPIEAEAAAPPVPVAPYDVQIEILDADVNQSPVAPEKRLVAEVRFEILGPEAKTLMKKEIPFEVLFRTVKRESGAANLVASGQRQLNPQTREYLVEQEFPIPVLGRYELETVILLLPPGEIMAFRFRVLPFSVVP